MHALSNDRILLMRTLEVLRKNYRGTRCSAVSALALSSSMKWFGAAIACLLRFEGGCQVMCRIGPLSFLCFLASDDVKFLKATFKQLLLFDDLV